MKLPIMLSGTLLLLLLAGCAGCGSSGTAPRGGASATGGFPDYLAESESTFHPSDYGIETWESPAIEGQTGAPGGTMDSVPASHPDTIPGFRVQVTITGDIDDANLLRDSLSRALSDEWVYIVHHPPYYKIRVGNFSERFAAGEMLERLRRHGFPDAWIVPDRILRNPLPKPAPMAPDTTDGTDTPR